MVFFLGGGLKFPSKEETGSLVSRRCYLQSINRITNDIFPL
jgi:hypothetical protein